MLLRRDQIFACITAIDAEDIKPQDKIRASEIMINNLNARKLSRVFQNLPNLRKQAKNKKVDLDELLERWQENLNVSNDECIKHYQIREMIHMSLQENPDNQTTDLERKR